MNTLERAKLSLEGLSIGDGFGQKAFGSTEHFDHRVLPVSPWYFTDDTEMALSIFDVLKRFGHIHQNALAQGFAQRYRADPVRGYGGSMHDTLRRIGEGESWKDVSRSAFDGMGSYGNGAAMRVAPVGAYFADDLDEVVRQAALSAEVTHAHPEATAGAIGIAVGAALAWQWKQAGRASEPAVFLHQIAHRIPDSEVKSRVLRASQFHPNTTMTHAVAVLGNGVLVSAQDTVPLALWCAATHLYDFEEALWMTVSALGDRDTTCAMAGGIVACSVGHDGIPEEWRLARESLPSEAIY